MTKRVGGRRWPLIMLTAAIVMAVVGAAACAQEGLLLRYKYQAGEVETYVAKGTFTGALGGAEAALMPVSMSVDMRMKVKTIEVSEEGVASQEMTIERMATTTETMGARMEMTAEEGKLTVTVDGEPVEMPEEMPGAEIFSKPLKTKVDARGRVLEMDLSSLGSMFTGLDFSSLQHITTLPEDPVALGQSWSQEIKLPLEVMGHKLELGVKCDSTLVGVEQYQGKEVLRINVKGSGEARSTEGEQLFQNLTITFSGHQFFNYSAGHTLFGKIHFEEAVMGPAVEGQAPTTMTMTGDLEMALQ